MKRPPLSNVIAVAALLAAVLYAPVARASAELARSKICMGCHAVERKLIGPAFKDVATRYAGQPGAAGLLSEKIVKGGSGVWGAVPMPANPKITPEEARQLAIWILSFR